MGETGDTDPIGRGRPLGDGNFYRAVVQAIILYGLEAWVISVAMGRKIEGSHIVLVRQIMGKQARRIGDGMWETPGEEVVLEAVGMQSEMVYIGKRQATMAQWLALQPQLKVCAG